MIEVSQNAQEWFDDILNSKWVVMGPNRLVDAQRDSTGQWLIGDIVTNDQEILQAKPDDRAKPLGFHLIQQGWKATIFRRYRPMAYFCAFHAEEVFGCVELAVKALINFAQWQHEIVIFTAMDTQELLQSKLAYLELGEKLHIIGVNPAKDQLDWCLTRYKVNQYSLLQQAQPLIYFDVDTLCNKPLDALLVQLIDSPYLHACKEGLLGEGDENSDGLWYGWRLMKEDGVPFNPIQQGFSSGVFIYQNTNYMAELFDLIIRSAYGYMEMNGGRDKLVSFDQRFANYILFKYQRVEIEILAKWVHLYRIAESVTPYPEITAKNRLGVIHFLSAPLAKKLSVMQDYMDALQGKILDFTTIKTLL